MNDLQIEYFLAVAKHLNITKVANEKFVTQPAVSRHISAMEEELGVKLFNRESKGLSLTQAGKIFVDYFEAHHKNLASLMQMVKGNDESEKRYLRIGCGNSWNLNPFLPEINKKMKRQYPNLSMSVESYGFEELIYALNRDKIDVAIGLSYNMYALDTLEICELTKISRVLLYSKYNPVTEKTNTPEPLDFKDQPFLVSINENHVLDMVNSYCKPYGFTPKIEITKDTETMFANISNGFAVAIVDEWTSRIYNKDYQYLPLNSCHSVSMAWKKDTRDEIVLTFIQKLKRAFPFCDN